MLQSIIDTNSNRLQHWTESELSEAILIRKRMDPKSFRGYFSLAMAFAAALITSTGWWWAYTNREWFSSISLWPMPSLFLIHWTFLCLLGLLSIIFTKNRAAWFIVGALIPLVYISLWSFGFLTFLSCLFMILAALIISVHPRHNWLETLGVVTLGAITNLMIVNMILFISQKMA